MTPVALLQLRGTRVRMIASFAVAGLLFAVAGATRSTPVSGVGDGTRHESGRHDSTFMALFSGPLPAVTSDAGVKALEAGLTNGSYTLASVRDDGAAVPRLFLARVPVDLPTMDSVGTRKETFVKMLLPLILAENERILDDRNQLVRMRTILDAGRSLSRVDTVWLAAIADRYDLEFDADEVEDLLDELLLRVDVIPPSLAIGQAALETGWGTSAAARGQAMFGQMVFGDGDRAEVRRFERLAHAVEAYALNLNTHNAYRKFREQRAGARSRDEVPSGYALAAALARYSERKMDYVRDVRGIIKANKLQPLDRARLDVHPQLAGG